MTTGNKESDWCKGHSDRKEAGQAGQASGRLWIKATVAACHKCPQSGWYQHSLGAQKSGQWSIYIIQVLPVIAKLLIGPQFILMLLKIQVKYMQTSTYMYAIHTKNISFG